MHLFYSPALAGDLLELTDEEAHHALSVLRLKRGDRIGLLNGKGLRAEAVLEEVDKRHCLAKVVAREQQAPEREAHIHLVVAPTKQMERFEWFVEKAVEVGADRITPLLASRTERSKLRTDRLQRVAVAAMKQSQRSWLPTIDALTTMDELLAMELPRQRYFGWCEGEHAPLMGSYDATSDVVIVIGPEGDLDPEEATQLRVKGFTAVSLGGARLRTETAALAACTWMSLAQQR